MAREAKPSPGPWSCREDGLGGPAVYDANGRAIALVLEPSSGGDGAANGGLFAAASELLDALEDLVSCAETLEEFQEVGSDFWLSLHLANEAARKAEGLAVGQRSGEGEEEHG
jgi:hypothetical protein